MTRELYRRQAFAAVAAAVAQDGAAASARIAIEKPVLTLAPDFGRLILAFHKFNNGAVRLKTRFTERESLSANRPLSRKRWVNLGNSLRQAVWPPAVRAVDVDVAAGEAHQDWGEGGTRFPEERLPDGGRGGPRELFQTILERIGRLRLPAVGILNGCAGFLDSFSTIIGLCFWDILLGRPFNRMQLHGFRSGRRCLSSGYAECKIFP
jgi:hypothetical protein